MQNPRILVVDDEETIRHVLECVLDEKGCEVRTAESAEAGLALIEEFLPDAALVDIVLPGMNGIQLLGEIKGRFKDTEVLVMTSNASADTAVQAMRQGAYDYLHKPFEDLDDVWITVNRALEKRALTLKNRSLLEEQEQRNRELSSSVSPAQPVGNEDDFGSYSELLEFFVDLISAELGVERVSLMLLGKDGELRIAASRGLDHLDVPAIQVPLGHGVAGSVAQSGEPFLVEQSSKERAGHDRSGSEPDPTPPLPVAISVPIKTENGVLGVINTTNRPSGKPFLADDVTHLSDLSDQLAVALEAAQRSQQLYRAYESLKDTQSQLAFAERIQAVGQMAAGVAHDFNNALAVIMGRAQLVLMKLRAPDVEIEKTIKDLETIIKTSQQGAQTIKRIQDYTRMRKDMPEAPVDLNVAVKDAIDISRPKWKEESEAHGVSVQVTKELQDIPLVSGNQYELTQVVGNLLFNAVEAMPEGGALTFRTFRDGEAVVLKVEDTGTGIDEENQKRLFEPFFTTKETGQGLGMSIVHGIITRHQGEIAVESEVGKGTKFTIRLPRLPSLAERARVSEAAPSVQPARLLVVDDDPSFNATLEESLVACGHSVVAAPDGQTALEKAGEQEFDLIITDLAMPGMSGQELAREVKQKDPSLPILLLTGWSVQSSRENQNLFDAVLLKPCPIDDLLRAIEVAARRATRP